MVGPPTGASNICGVQTGAAGSVGAPAEGASGVLPGVPAAAGSLGDVGGINGSYMACSFLTGVTYPQTWSGF